MPNRQLDSINPLEKPLPLDSFDPAQGPVTLDSSAPDRGAPTTTTEQRITLDLIVRMDGDFPATAVLLALLWRSADRTAVRISSRSLAASTRLGHQVIQRALKRLERRALVTSKKLPRATAAYRVNVPALRQLLCSPLPDADFLPGFTPIPALSRLNDVPGGGEVPSAPT